MFYHETRDAALLAGAMFDAQLFDTKVELEPYNGWVLVLRPKSLAAFDAPLGPLLEHAELDLSTFERLRKRPTTYRSPPATVPKPTKSKALDEADVSATWKSGDSLPW